MLEDRQPGGGQSANADVFRVRGSVKRRLRRAAVDFGQRVLQQLYGGQNLKNKGTSLNLRCSLKSDYPAIFLQSYSSAMAFYLTQLWSQ